MKEHKNNIGSIVEGVDEQSYLKIKMDCNKLGCLKLFSPVVFQDLLLLSTLTLLEDIVGHKAVIHSEEISSRQVVIASDIGKT